MPRDTRSACDPGKRPMSVTTHAQRAILPSPAALGADVEGVALDAPGADDIAHAARALRDRLVIRLRGYALDDVAFTRLAERFGELGGLARLQPVARRLRRGVAAR